ncbi:acetylornithine deacetylase [Candidatus Pantoea edessiphila]|uniref:Acetylornithine deacetylase n=1 Tax=Candidatus Pantoea edessiphila TaxID=2044610 RepID=A0A2P5SZ32_9GAMM|nr:acetylornithine deacetylase [Candidatus Pantoea edessiphila]MBK4775267.1 acetylornithine deacetylase [Pantoea sp. Edef]PPI87594.1 acetylornithine deacetylase [Candidatus Pantoea edessiphila]
MKNKLPSFIECYRKLISIPSVSSTDRSLDCSNKILINVLANWFDDLGLKVELNSIPNTNNKFNLLAKTRDKLGGLMLTGHTDTVPFDPIFWKYDPFTLTEFNNKLYGLGTVDMKGFFAFVVDVLCDINIKKLQKPLYILATADEETTMIGANIFSRSTKLRPDFAIIGEPTSLKPVCEHRGYISSIIRVSGKSGHSSIFYSDINTIELMQKVIFNLIKLRDFFKKNKYNKFTKPHLIVNFGCIKGGDVANRVCSYCELHLDIRFIPSITINDVNELVNKVLKPITIKWGNRITIETLYPPIPAYKCSTDNIFIKKIQKLLNKNLEVVNYCTEAPFIQQLCPTVVFGPGSIKQAHQPNEFMHMSYIKPTYNSIHRIINHFCN